MTLITITRKDELYALQNISIDQIVYCSLDNCFYHLRDWSRKEKVDAWRMISSRLTTSSAGIHDLVGSSHTVSGLTTGHFLKALSGTTFGFAAHGLTYTDVNAISKNNPSVDKEILTWNGITGNAVRTNTGVSIDSGNVLANADCIAYASGPPAAWTPYTFRYSIVESGGYVNLVGDAASPGLNKMYGTDGTGTKGWFSVPAAMVYPGAGLAKSTGSAWDTSITDNSANWNTAYGWGNWASNFGSIAGKIAEGNDSRIVNGQTAFGWGNHASAGYATAANLNTHTGNTSNPHSVTATQVGLGNVTNESKATMFTSPVFTGNDMVHRGNTFIQRDATETNGITLLSQAGANQYIYSDYWGAGSDKPLVLGCYVHHTDQLYLNTDGNVGIGKVPTHEFDVSGTIVASGDIIAYHA